MRFKLILALAEEEWTDALLHAAREAGATGSTVITHAKGESMDTIRAFLGISFNAHSDVLMFLVEEHLSLSVIEALEKAGHMQEKGTGIAFQMDVEDIVGLSHQVEALVPTVEELL
jgi:hypothetical protein